MTNKTNALIGRLVAGCVIASALAVVAWSCAGSLEGDLDSWRDGSGLANNCFGNADAPAFLSASECSQCHLSRTNGKGAAFDVLSPDPGGRWSVLEGSCPTALIVDPANPRASTLYQYVVDQVVGCTYHIMPPTGAAVSAGDAQCLLTWIDGLDEVDDLGMQGGGGGGGGGDSDGGGDDDGGGGTPSGQLAALQTSIFNTKCTGCHSGSTPQRGLRLAGITTAELHANIVNVQAQQSGLDYIEPNDPEQSFLYQKVLGDNLSNRSLLVCSASCGAKMPADGTALTDPEEARLLQWINAGAPAN